LLVTHNLYKQAGGLTRKAVFLRDSAYRDNPLRIHSVWVSAIGGLTALWLLFSPVMADGLTTAFQPDVIASNMARSAPIRLFVASGVGIDCSGSEDSTSALQSAINALPDMGSITFPDQCNMLLGSGLGTQSIITIGYNASTGVVTMTFASLAKISVGSLFVVTGVTGVPALNGFQTAISGTSGTIVKFQAALGLTNLPSGGSLQNCGITISGRTGLQFLAASKNWQNVGGNTVQFSWNGRGGIMFCLNHDYHPVFYGLGFQLLSGKTIDEYLHFDGAGSPTGSAGNIEWSTFNGAPQENLKFIAISISATAGTNQENYFVSHSSIQCSGSAAVLRSVSGSITVGSPNLHSASGANFTSADVGERIRASYATGILDTKILSVSDSTSLVMADNALSTQSDVTVHTNQSYGIGVYVGPTSNAKNQQFYNMNISNCARGFDIENGSFEIHNLGGGSNDLAVYVNQVTEPSGVSFDQSEGNMRGLFIYQGSTPISYRSVRLDLSRAEADGWIKVAGLFDFESNRITALSGASNMTLFSPLNKNASVVSTTNNLYNLTFSQINYGSGGFLSVNGDLFQGSTLQFSILNGLPTSASGLYPGQVWNNGGTLSIAP
jgi:hypothetical protein